MTTKDPCFSVLIAQYNNAKYLPDAINSILAQTYTNWEIIIVDDCSTDESKEIYKRYSDHPQIKIFFNEKNQGVGYTKHRCAELASGDICGYLDPDDTLVLDALEKHVKLHCCRPDVSVVYSYCNFCDENLNVKEIHRLPSFDQGETFLSKELWGNTTAFTSFKMLYYNQTEGISCYRAGDDQDLNYKLEEVGACTVLESVTYNYRLKKESLSRGENESECLYWNLKVVSEACHRRGIDDKKYIIGVLTQIQDWSIRKGYRLAQKSYSYKIGDILIKPLRFLLNKKHYV